MNYIDGRVVGNRYIGVVNKPLGVVFLVFFSEAIFY